MTRWRLALGVVFTLSTVAAQAAEPETVLGTVVDFAELEPGPYARGYLDYWRWTDEFRARAKSYSKLEVAAEAAGKHALRVQIDDAALFEHGPLPLLRLAPFYPPEADVLRLHVKIVSGKLRTFAGGPTAYYANSDVYTRVAEGSAAAEPRWTTLDLSLNHPLRRNFRRSGLSTEAERNYYNRWAQEPLGIFLESATQGEFLVERIELVGRGEGRPFPKFDPVQVQTVRPIADFEDGRKDDLFTLYMAAAETEWFEESWRRDKPLRFTPSLLEIIDGEKGNKLLRCVGPSAEEVHCAGIRTAAGAPEANAIQLDVRHDAPAYRNTLVGAGRVEAIDVLVFVAPPQRPVTWQAFAASEELRKLPGPGFDYQLTYRDIRNRQDADFAIYQTRRYLKPQEWTTLVLPVADFVCIYGSGVYRERFLRNQPLSCDDVTAVAWLNPWCRIGRSNEGVELRLDNLEFVRVPGRPEALRSFWQLEANDAVEWGEATGARGRERIMLVDGETW